jgi:CBS domain-containing protein/ribosome-associated translation inhibitor RaiA
LSKSLKELALTEISQLLHSHGSVFKPSDQVSKVLGFLYETERSEAVAAGDGKFGIITLQDLLGVDQPQRTRIDNIWSQVGTVNSNANVLDVIEVMKKKKVDSLPVVNGDEVVGVISQKDITYAMCDTAELSNYNARDIIQSNFISVDIGTGVAYARRMMLNKGVNNIPVLEEGKLAGLISAETIVHTFIAPGSKTTRGDRSGIKVTRFPGNVEGVMDVQPLTVHPEASVLDVVCGMRDTEKHVTLIVNNENEVHGTITSSEILSVVHALRAKPELQLYILGISDEDFFERAVAEGKIRRVVEKSLKMHPITEVSVRVKKQSVKGERTRYQLTARALGPNTQFSASNEDWGLMEAFDGLCDALDKTLRRSKRDRQKGPRRGRRRKNPHLNP